MRCEKRNALVTPEAIRMVKDEASVAYARCSGKSSMKDLVGAGFIGLLKARDAFDSTRGTFLNYARTKTRGAILDYKRSLDWLSRDMRRRVRKMEETREALAETSGQVATDQDVAERMGVSIAMVREAKQLLEGSPTSLTRRAGHKSDNETFELDAVSDIPSPFDQAVDSQMRSLIAAVLGELPNRYRRVMELYYTGEMTMKDIGHELGVNESRVSQIHKAALLKCRETLERRGIHSAV